MAARNRTKKNPSQKVYKDALTQTSPESNEIEINRLKEEVHLLRRELFGLKKNQQPINPGSHKQEKPQLTIVAEADSPQAQKISQKGCNCKGKCSNRICGCVKKQTACTAACKCQHKKCENKDSNKENIGAENPEAKIASEVDQNTKLLSKLKLRKHVEDENAEGAASLSNKLIPQVRKPGNHLFSPDSPDICKHEISVSRLGYGDDPIEFIPHKKNVRFDSNSDSDSDSSSVEKRKRDKKSRRKLREEKFYQEDEKSDSGDEKTKKLLKRIYYDGRKTRGDNFDLEDIGGSKIAVKNLPAKEKIAANNEARVPIKSRDSDNVNLEKPNEQEAEIGIETPKNVHNKKSEKLVQRNLESELELEIVDPMKPTRQLQRTPVQGSPQINRSRLSELPVPYNGPREEKEQDIVPPPEGIDEPHVNWDEHCRQLIACRLCNRTFYPFRLAKHEASCKKI